MGDSIGRDAPAYRRLTTTPEDRLDPARVGVVRMVPGLPFEHFCAVCGASGGFGFGSDHNRGGNRQANAALYRVVIVRMRAHQPTLDYVKRRTAEGKSKPEIIRCLKRFVAREIFGYLCRPSNAQSAASTGP